MAVTNRYKGDCRVDLTDGLGNHRAAALRVVNDNSAISDRAGYELDAGASLTFYYRDLETAAGSNPNKVTIRVYYETGTGTLIREYQNLGAKPAHGASFTFFATTNGTSGGAARAGVARLYLRVVKDDAPGGLGNYDSDTDGTFNNAAAWVAATADSGCLRSNALVSNLTVSAYPSGSTFAYPDTLTLTATHTQRWADTNIETAALDVINASDTQEFAGTTKEVGTTSTTQNFTVSDSWSASAANYGVRVRPVDNSGFVPTSGAILWTALKADGANVTQDGNNVKRSTFYAVDPRLTALHHMQLDDSTFGVAKDAGTTSRRPDQIGYLATRIVNARSEGQNGITVSRVLDPAGAAGVNRTASGATATRDSQAGWTDLMLWDAGAPTGTWDLSDDITAPAAADANTHLTGGALAYAVNAVGGYPRSRVVNA